MHLLRSLPCLLLAAGFAASLAQARLGDSESDLRNRYGRPQGHPKGDTYFWMFENDFGAMLYTVTLNSQGRSIAEGLKPYRRTGFTAQDAETFIGMQFEGRPEAERRTLQPGAAYRFAGQDFTCGKDEQVIVDENAGILVVWTKSSPPSVLAVSPEMVQRTK